MENQELKAQLESIRKQLQAKQTTPNFEQQSTLNAIVQQMQMQNQMNQFMMANQMKFLTPPHIPSPMTVGMPPHMTHPPHSIHQSVPPQLPHSIPFNDRRGGHGIYNPPNGTMFYFPSKSSINGSNNNDDNKNNNNNNNNKNTVDMDQVINNNTMNMDISMSSASLSDDSSIINDKHINDNNYNNNKNKNKNDPATSHRIDQHHHEIEGCPPPKTDESPIPPSISNCVPQISGVSAVLSSTVCDHDDIIDESDTDSIYEIF